ncbi:Phosphatidylinositol-4-phosphate-5-kinase (PIPK-D1/GPCR-PIPK/PiGK1) [Plasmopara halstedii]|uniref:Phosphatidylinositol-4-phosphate-5-kinase (PIPK-D1/GPCR-PIPK/PiGK1) n=1 Tax=Plasmopara halstedii TaxID=4781 RepID=A0A0P1B640_PLAHL|nr:Phosphatidylinositol-4-phosphate-5-kinase (PIPK-D1/GPCR-PIPK/PiGK1) [Plasmopara halstedii]CEG49730.1 Phosphatidylinositol-4-phosphate-5-kinase (PIPK-D1/GPCR-PIPK/PiGK1) [Plasmopara halstedii]|eukprot:XP_024586099.1 Phosphatidylinositol-4-phosphate-5-kinase (PIPK-D1/GPCR-PIPK/PiGK1) [Plasmopara halstedii]
MYDERQRPYDPASSPPHASSPTVSDPDVNMLHVGDHATPAAMRTCLHSTTRWFQLVMFFAFVIALVLAMGSSYDNLSPGLIWGGILSIFSVFFVILSYVSVPSYRQHPNPLVFWRTIADAIFVLQLMAQQFVRCLFFDCVPLCSSTNLQCGCSFASGASSTCSVFAGLFEFTLLASECWFFCMTANLLMSLTNPFTDFKRNTRVFHLGSWLIPLVLGLLLMNTDDWAGYSDLGVCWTNALKNLPADNMTECASGYEVTDNFSSDYKAVNANIISWLFFYVWMGLFIIFGIAVWVWAWKRLSEGMPETYAVRVQSINRARFNVFAVTFYWIIVVIVYIKFLSRDRSKPDKSSELLNFFIAGKGYLDLVIWFALNDFHVAHFTRCLGENTGEIDVDLNPQVNAALRREVLFYTTSGIIQAVQAAERLPASQRIQHLALLPQTKATTASRFTAMPVSESGSCARTSATYAAYRQQQSNDMEREGTNGATAFDENMRVAKNSPRTKTFHDYEPHAFKKIRERFGVNNEAYLQALSATAKERLSEGASGAFMFFSADGSLIVKSTSKEECSFLRSIAQDYADYLCSNPRSLLLRFYGCHCLELYGKQFSFVVMANLFDTDQVIHSRYDIKGSWVNRHGDLPKRGKKVTCRHCNRKYLYQNSAPENANCTVRLGGHEPNVVLKDSDLTQKLNLDRDVALDLYQQLSADSHLLCSFGIMDYSLLMGINEVEYVVDEGSSTDDDSDTTNTSMQSKPQGTKSKKNPMRSSVFKNPLSENVIVDPRVGGGAQHLARSKGPTGGSKARHHASVSSNIGSYSTRSAMGDTVMQRKASKPRDFMNNRSRNGRTESNTSSSGRRLPRSGMRMANTVVGPAYYHLGVIDILQTWTLQKRMERFFKIVFRGVDGDGLSAIPPKLYQARFQLKMADILGVEDLVSGNADLDIFTQQNSHMDVDTQQVDQQYSIQSIRSLASSELVAINPLDSHYANSRSSSILRQRSTENSQSVGQDTEEYTGIDYHL